MYIDICVCVYIRRTIERRMKVHTLCACVCCPIQTNNNNQTWICSQVRPQMYQYDILSGVTFASSLTGT